MKSRLALENTRTLSKIFSKLLKKRFFQFLVKTLKPKGNMAWVRQEKKDLRVPPEEYRATMTQLVREIRDAGATPILITAPRAPSISAFVVHRGTARSVEEAQDLHDRYVEITREIAETEGIRLIDLAAEFEDADGIFSGDGIHFTDEGLDRVAAEVHRALLAQ